MFAGPPPMLNACPAMRAHVGLRQQERVDQIVDEQHVAHLQAVAVERDRLAVERLDQEVRDPALILGAELVRAVDAAHAEHGRRQPKVRA